MIGKQCFRWALRVIFSPCHTVVVSLVLVNECVQSTTTKLVNAAIKTANMQSTAIKSVKCAINCNQTSQMCNQISQCCNQICQYAINCNQISQFAIKSANNMLSTAIKSVNVKSNQPIYNQISQMCNQISQYAIKSVKCAIKSGIMICQYAINRKQISHSIVKSSTTNIG